MSDQSPPPKPKPGSLRDRIAAFENKGTAAPPPGPTPPLPRPKPGGLQWKPRPPSPPTSPDPTHSQTTANVAASSVSGGGMSASDAMESIGRGGSLKERMAALQGKGAFAGPGAPPPPIAPKPLEKPKWKPPPVIPAPADEEHGESVSLTAERREASRSPPPRGAAVSPRLVSPSAPETEGDAVTQAGEGGENDPEEEERQRRAAIAARMARLGGTRVGMGPPIFAPKPVVRKAEPPVEAKGEDAPVEASGAQSPPPHDAVSITSRSPVLAPELESKQESESAPVAPSRSPASMPVPAGPRRAAPPRKKVSKPTTSLPEPPAEPESAPVQPPTVSDETLVIADRVTESDASVVAVNEQKETIVAAAEVEADVPPEVEHVLAPALSAPTEEFHESVKEPEKHETEEELVEGDGSHADEASMHTAVEEEHEDVIEHEKQEEVAEEEDEEARRTRVAARLAQMGAFNPLAGPPPIPSRDSLEEEGGPTQEPLDVEDEVNVDTEEYGETIPPPPVVPPRHDSVESLEHHHVHDVEAEHQVDITTTEPHAETEEDTNGEEEDRVPIQHDGESQANDDDEHRDGGHQIEVQEQGEPSNSVIFGDANIRQYERDQDDPYPRPQLGTYPVLGEEQDERRSEIEREDVFIASSTGYTANRGEEEEKATEVYQYDDSEENEDEMAPSRITRPIPPPPVNFGSKPTSPSTPPPAKTPVQVLRATADEEERPASPDMPPRPVPPPVRSVPPPALPPAAVTEEVTRRPVPPPTRRTSTRVTDVLEDVPSTPPPPPLPTSPKPNRRPTTPPIITSVSVQELGEDFNEERGAGEEPTETNTPQAEVVVVEDEDAVRHRTIAERMARLGGIRFGAPPQMNPLVRPPLPAAPPPTSIPPDDNEADEKEKEEEQARGVEEEEEEEMARKQRIAARLAGMGGMRFGMMPATVGLPARRIVTRQEDSENEDAIPPVPVPAPTQRYPPVRKPPPPIDVPVEQEQQAQDQDHEQGPRSRGTSDDGVRVEVEDSEIEEVRYSDVDTRSASTEEEEAPLPPPRRPTNPPRSAEVLPTPPPRVTSQSPPPGRPPIPTIPKSMLRKQSGATTGPGSAPSSRKTSLDDGDSSPGDLETPTVLGQARPQSEYVMVEADPEGEEEIPAPPPRRQSSRGGPPRSYPLPPPPPPSAIDPPEELASSTQWELPSIPQGAEYAEDLASSGWSEDSTAVHVPPPGSARGPGLVPTASTTFSDTDTDAGSRQPSTKIAPSSGSSGRRSRSIDQQQQLSVDDLMTIWGQVGTRVVDAAAAMFEKSKRALVGDGSYAGFVRAVLAQVPGVLIPSSGDEWGYIIYAQNGNAVQRRVSEIMPGDVIALWDAKLKGHKGLHAYSLTVGAGESGPLVGVVSEFDGKKSKVRVWQANQHVGQQTVESASYRLEDLKSGQVKIFRVLQA